MIGNKVIKFSTLDSTNKYIKDNLFDLEIGTIVTTDYQTNGYGRKNRSWIDNSLSNLTFSFLIKQKITSKTTLLSQLIGASIITALKELNIDAKIKWPNDILINNKKVAGILVETKIIEDDIYIVIGIGLNVNTTLFDESIVNKATSLKLETSKTYNLDTTLTVLLKHINNHLDNFNNKDYSFLNICKRNNALLNKEIILESTNELATVIDIDSDGQLVVLVNNEKRKYFGSEISLSNSYNLLGE